MTWNYSQGDVNKATLIFQINRVTITGQKETNGSGAQRGIGGQRTSRRLHSTLVWPELGSFRWTNSQMGEGRGGSSSRSISPHLLSHNTTDCFWREEDKPTDQYHERDTNYHDSTPTTSTREWHNRNGLTREPRGAHWPAGQSPNIYGWRERPAWEQEDTTTYLPHSYARRRSNRKTEGATTVPRLFAGKTGEIINGVDSLINHHTMSIWTEPKTPFHNTLKSRYSKDSNMDRARTGHCILHQDM
jgi:hypothetical protein